MNHIRTHRIIWIGLFSLLIRARRDTIKRGNRPAKLALIVAFLLVVSSWSAAFGAGLDDYVEGSGGEFACFPEEDHTPCGPKVSGAAKTIFAVFKECSEMTKDPATQEKYAVIVQFLAQGPPGWAAAGAFATAEGLEDLLKCTLKGFNRVSAETEDEKKALDTTIEAAFLAYDWKETAENLYRWLHLDPRSLSQAAEAYSVHLRAGEISQFDSMLRTLGELIGGPFVVARNNLKDADELSSRCNFDRAKEALREAEKAMIDYCKGVGREYRRMERALRCYEEWNLEKLMRPTLERDKYYFKYNQLVRKREIIVGHLGMFQQIKNMKTVIEKRKEFFLRQRKTYKWTALLLEMALDEGDLKTACHAMLGLKSIKDKATKGYINCPDKVAPNLEALEARVWDLLYVKTAEVEELLGTAENAINSGMTDDARYALRAAREKIPRLVGPADGRCRLALEEPQLRDRLEKLEKRLEEEPSKGVKETRRFDQPTIDGYRLDWCHTWGVGCGGDAANAFCQKMGYKRAVKWEEDHDIGDRTPTKCIGTGEICNYHFCDGFKYIICEK